MSGSESKPAEKDLLRQTDATSSRSEKRFVEVHSGTLFGSAQEVRIRHRGELYRLCETRAGKLILTK